MSEFLSKFRAKYPEYDSIGDVKLVKALNAKYNAESGTQLAEDEFYSQIGYTPTPTVSIEPPQAINADGSPMIGVDTPQTSPVFNQPQDLLPQPDIALEQNAMQIGGQANVDPMDSIPQVGGLGSPVEYSPEWQRQPDYTPDLSGEPINTPTIADRTNEILAKMGATGAEKVAQLTGSVPAMGLQQDLSTKALKAQGYNQFQIRDMQEARPDTLRVPEVAPLQAVGGGVEKGLESMESVAGNLSGLMSNLPLPKNVKNALSEADKYVKDKAGKGVRQTVGLDEMMKAIDEQGIDSLDEIAKFVTTEGIASIPRMVLAVQAMPIFVAEQAHSHATDIANNKGKKEYGIKEFAQGVPIAVGSALLERIGYKGATSALKQRLGVEIVKGGLSHVSKKSAGAALKGGAEEMLTEGAQTALEHIGTKLGTDVKIEANQFGKELFGSMLVGGAMGTGLGAATGAAKGLSDVKAQKNLDKYAEQQALNAMKPPLKVVEKAPEKVEEVEAVEEEVKQKEKTSELDKHGYVAWEENADPIFDEDTGDESEGEPYALISRVEVYPDSRGKGYGKTLVRNAIAEIQSENPNMEIKLHPEPFDNESGNNLDSEQLVSFYEGLGFEVDKNSPVGVMTYEGPIIKQVDKEVKPETPKVETPTQAPKTDSKNLKTEEHYDPDGPDILKSKRPTPSNFETVKTLTSKATRRKDIRVYKGDKNTYDPLSASITLREDATAEQGQEIAKKTKEKDGDWKGEEIELTFKDEAKQTYKDTVNAGEIMAEYKEQSRLIKAVKDCLE